MELENQNYKQYGNSEKSGGEKEIDLLVLFKHLLKKWWIIVLAAVLAGVLSLAYARFLVKPTYRSYFTAYVNNKQSRQTSDSLTNSDILASQELVRTYSKILTGNTMLMKAAEALGDEYTYRDLAKMVKTQPQDDTELITVYVTAGTKEEAYKVCAAIESISPDMMAEKIKGSSMAIIDTTQMPDMRHSPSYTKYALIGTLIGGFAAILIIIIRYFLNDKVPDENALEERYKLPVVGVIPDMSSTGPHGYYGRYGRYGYYGRKRDSEDVKEDNQQ